jgi:hypothetical protein
MAVDIISSSALRTPPESARLSPAAESAARPKTKPPEPAPEIRSAEGESEPRGVPRRIVVEQQLPPNTRLRVDEESNQIVAQILDENNEVVRQIPPEALLELSSKFNKLEGLLFDREI